VKDKNKVELEGTVTYPEVKRTSSGKAFTKFNVKTDEKYPVYVPCVAWDQEIDLTKGDKVYVWGKFASNRWKDRDGNNRTSYYISVIKLDKLEAKRDEPEDVPF